MAELAGKIFTDVSDLRLKERPFDTIYNYDYFERFIKTYSANLSTRLSYLEAEKVVFSTAKHNIRTCAHNLGQLVFTARKHLAEFPYTIMEIKKELDSINLKSMQTAENLKQATTLLKEKEEEYLRQAKEGDEHQLTNKAFEEAKNALATSFRAVNQLKRNDIDDFRSFISPPSAVLKLSEAICLLFDRPISWVEAKQLLNNNLASAITSLELKGMPDSKFDKLKKFHELLSSKITGFQSSWVAVRALAIWFCNLVNYLSELREIESFSKINRKAELRMIKMNSDRAEVEKISYELRTLEKKYISLRQFLWKNVGKYALIKEIFSVNSIFDRDELNDMRHISESQWIQTVFHGEEGTPVYESAEVTEAHKEYQDKIFITSKIRSEYEQPPYGTTNDRNLREMNDRLRRITVSALREFFSLQNSSFLENTIKETLLKLLDLPSGCLAEACFDKLHRISIKSLAQDQTEFLRSLSTGIIFKKMAFYGIYIP